MGWGTQQARPGASSTLPASLMPADAEKVPGRQRPSERVKQSYGDVGRKDWPLRLYSHIQGELTRIYLKGKNTFHGA